MSMDLDHVLTTAQRNAAKKALSASIDNAIKTQLSVEANRIARKYVKDNKPKIEKELRKHLAKAIKAELPKLARAHLKSLTIHSNW